LTSKIQYSNRVGDAILAIGGDVPEEFLANARAILGDENAESFENALMDFMPGARSTAEAVATVQAGIPGSYPIHSFPNTSPPANMNSRQQELQDKGFIADKYGNWWHPRQFDQAPTCQCSSDKNRGKLALKVGTSKSGEEFTGWFCPNTFGRARSQGCQAIFNKNYPEL
jgi:hypothetical protein